MIQADEGGQQIRAQHRDEIFRLLVQSVKDYAIFLLDTEGYIQTWNEGARRIKGYLPHEIIGKHFSTFYQDEENERGMPAYELEVAAREGKWEGEGWRIRRDGTTFWANVVITALFDADGTLVGYAKVTRDLTERKQAEDERIRLLARERAARTQAERALEHLRGVQEITEAALAHLNLDELLKALLDRIARILTVDTVAILLVDDKDPSVLVARAARGIEEEVEQGVRIPIGTGFAGRIAADRHPLILDDVAHADVHNPLLREKGIKSLLGVPLMVEGRVVGILHVGTLHPRKFTDDDAQFLQIVADRAALAIDHARLYRLATTAQHEAALAEAKVQARDEFLSVAAHELRTPMTSLRLAVQVLLRQLSHTSTVSVADLEGRLRTVDRQVHKLSRLVSQLLETVRLEAGRVKLERRRSDLTVLIGGVVEEMQLQDSRHKLVFSAPESLPAMVDETRIEQVVVNLLDNAIKFSPDGTEIDIILAVLPDDQARLEVRDRGPGVAPEHRAHLFERFYQATDLHRSGMGLGLYITRAIVEEHGGTIRVEFPPDGGTSFIIELPTAAER